jgi:hypothetical protein
VFSSMPIPNGCTLSASSTANDVNSETKRLQVEEEAQARNSVCKFRYLAKFPADIHAESRVANG